MKAGRSQVVGALIAKAHRRRIIVQLVEAAAAGAAIGAAGALPVLSAMILLGRNGTAAAWAGAALGVLGGLAWSFSRRPTRLATAIEIDQQLRTGDLFSTSLVLRERNPWSETVAALAEARAATVEVGKLRWGRLSPRGWSAAGLTVLLALVLGLFSGREAPRERAWAGERAAPEQPQAIHTAEAPTTSSPPGTSRDQAANREMTEPEGVGEPREGQGRGRGLSPAAGAGGGSARSAAAQSERLNNGAGGQDATGPVAGGGAINRGEGNGTGATGTGVGRSDQSAAALPPSDEGADSENSQSAHRPVEDRYRPLVREFFDHN